MLVRKRSKKACLFTSFFLSVQLFKFICRSVREMWRKLAYLLIAAGIFVILLPKMNEWKADRQQHHLLKEAEAAVAQADAVPVDRHLQSSYQHVSRLLQDEADAPAATSATPTASKDSTKQPIGIITIDRIDLKLPILEGATKANMRHAATHMAETTPLGQVGNAAIAAHRAHTKGRLFNRLNEVKTGDRIVISTDQAKYIYTVYKISIVKPTDVSVLRRNKTDTILTLITCDPLKNPTHRLIVQAKLQ